MDRGFFLRAVVVSAAVAVLLPFLYTVAFGYSVEYNPPMDPKEFHAKSYEQQQEWLNAHAVTLNGWQTLKQRVGELWFWREYAVFFAMAFLALLIGCISFGLWERKALRSDTSLNTDAQKSRAG